MFLRFQTDKVPMESQSDRKRHVPLYFNSKPPVQEKIEASLQELVIVEKIIITRCSISVIEKGESRGAGARHFCLGRPKSSVDHTPRSSRVKSSMQQCTTLGEKDWRGREGWYGVESFVSGYVQMISPAGLAPFPVMHADREYHRPSTPD
jgi:hypothetical protein